MHARAVVATGTLEAEGGRAGRTVISMLRSEPPLALRQTGAAAVHLVSTGAGPLGGDRLELHLDVAPGTTLEFGSVAATLVLPGAGASELLITATVGDGAVLRFTPEPTVLAAGIDHHQRVRLALHGSARVLWREELIMGRHGEPTGQCTARFDATHDGRPLLRQELRIPFPSPAVYGDARCLGSTLLAGAKAEAQVGEGVAVLPLEGPGTLVSALADDAVELRRRLVWGESVLDAGW